MKKILISVSVIALAVLVYIYQSNILQLVVFIESERHQNPLSVAAMLVGLKTFSAPLGFPGTPLTLLAGSLFGYYVGTTIAIIGNTLGACLAFLLSRYVLRDYVQKRFIARYPKISGYEKKLSQKGLVTVIILRLIPLFPFNALNFLLGVTNITFREYALGSMIGMIPGTFLFVYFGSSLRMLQYTNIILAVVGIIALIYLGKYYGKKI